MRGYFYGTMKAEDEFICDSNNFEKKFANFSYLLTSFAMNFYKYFYRYLFKIQI